MGSTGDRDVGPINVPTAFLDASVLIPAAISGRGTSRDLLGAGRRGAVRLVASQDVLDEAERNLFRKRPEAIRTFWDQRDLLEIVAPGRDLVIEIARRIEPKDTPVVAGAIVAGATYLVSYDRRHLLREADLIRQAYGIEVVTPDYLVALIGDRVDP